MKICITSSGENLESQIDPRFGRCRYFIIWDSENNSHESFANPNIDAGSGAGIQSAQLVVAKNMIAVVTGEIGPKAEAVLNSANVRIITGAIGSVKNAIEKYGKSNMVDSKVVSQESAGITQISSETKSEEGFFKRFFSKTLGFGGRGMGGGSGCGVERGGGRGMGIGCGRGMGRGRGSSMGQGVGQGYVDFCVCPECGEKMPHQRGIPCNSINCPKCNSPMMRV